MSGLSITDLLYRLCLVYVMPIGISNIGWKMYMINGAWDVITLILIVSLLHRPIVPS